MKLVKREDLQEVKRPSEVVDVPELGGAVEVRALMLDDALTFLSTAAENAGRISNAKLLALTVFDGNGNPLRTAEQWDLWGIQNRSAALKLSNVAMRLSDFFAEEAEKK